MSNKFYDVMKWIVLVGMHGLNYLWTELADVWNFPYAVEISKTISIVAGALGIWLGISSVKYWIKNKEKESEIEAETKELENEEL